MMTSLTKRLSPIFLIIALATICANADDWDKTVSIQGRGTRQTCVFPIVGERWRIRYAPKGRGNVKIELMDENGVVVSTPISYKNVEMPVSASGKSSPALRNAALRIVGDTNGWSCAFEQYVNEAAGWEIFRWRKNYSAGKNLKKYAMWTGDAGDEVEFPLTVDAKRWRVLFETFESGKVKVELLDGTGKCHLLNYHLDKGTSDGWVFNSGEYILKVTSVGSSWAVSAEVEDGFNASKLVK